MEEVKAIIQQSSDSSLSESVDTGDSSMIRESFSLNPHDDTNDGLGEETLEPISQPNDDDDRIRDPKEALTRRVSFTSLEIREYPVIPGSHPECSSGCPIELGWEYHSQSELSLDHYEAARHPRRPREQLRLSVQERESLLSAHDCPLAEVRRAARRHHRSKSCEGRFCQRNMQSFFSMEG